MRITSGGDVGIGTTSPSRNLTVATSGATYFSVTGGASSDVGVLFGTSASDAKGRLIYNNADNMQFWTASAEHMRITSVGNVGIGTSSPTDKLVVVGGRTTLTANSEVYQLKLAYNTSTDGFWLGSPSADALAFYNNAGTERMRITSGGDVGIGTTSPADLLDITRSSASNSSGGLTLTNTDNSGYGSALNWNLKLNSTAGVWGRIYTEAASSTATYMSFQTTIGSSLGERMRITSGGELLINTTSDAGDYKLQVNGNTLTSGSITTAAPSGGTAKPWKLGNYVSTAVTLDAAYIEVEIDGVAYKLATVYLPEPDPEPTSGPSLGYKTIEKPIVKLKSDSQKVKDLEKEIAELKELIKTKIK
jgi:hypothetical protein